MFCVLEIQKSPKASAEETNTTCFLVNVRDKGTDLPNNVIARTKTIDAKGCQRRCQKRDQCNFFLFFTPTHSQWYKRRECRLLNERGALEVNSEGHISGPKSCKVMADSKNDEQVASVTSLDFQMEEFINSVYDNFIQPNNMLISRTCNLNYKSINGKYNEIVKTMKKTIFNVFGIVLNVKIRF